ncbi:Uncharacterised protein [uncultured archaeon]|nr:Uncharacterised protein [uncultured archaeon]
MPADGRSFISPTPPGLSVPGSAFAITLTVASFSRSVSASSEMFISVPLSVRMVAVPPLIERTR